MNGIVTDSYATGRVFNNTYSAGGLVGLSNGTIINSYAIGQVSGTGLVGGLIGWAGRDAPATTTNSYWDTQASGVSGSSTGIGKTTAQMKQQATFTNWDFNTIWQINQGVSYPTFKTASTTPATVITTVAKSPTTNTNTSSASATQTNPATNNTAADSTSFNAAPSTNNTPLVVGNTAPNYYNDTLNTNPINNFINPTDGQVQNNSDYIATYRPPSNQSIT
jgi:hypothetical protein